MKKRLQLADRIRSAKPIVGPWMSIPHPIVAETLAQTGVDFLLLDGEHAPVPPYVLGSLLPSVELYELPVIYRVCANRAELIKAALDHGVAGVMVPMISSRGEAESAVAAAKYAPLGKRGVGAWRASNYYVDETAYMATANTLTSIILQIETKEAMQALDEIAAVPGVDALYVGPADLAMSMGLEHGADGALHPTFLDACARVADAARKNGIAAGIDVASLEYVRAYRDMGFSILTYGSDFNFILSGGREAQRNLKAMLVSRSS